MKKFVPFIVVGAIILVVVMLFLSLGKQKQMVVTFENPNKKPIELQLNKYQDAFCGMVIEDARYASQVIRDDGKSWFFHDHGDFVECLKDKPFKNRVTVYVHTIDTKKWIDATKAYYSTTESTPMGYGFGAYEHNGAKRIGFNEMQLRVLRGESMLNPAYRKILEKTDG